MSEKYYYVLSHFTYGVTVGMNNYLDEPIWLVRQLDKEDFLPHRKSFNLYSIEITDKKIINHLEKYIKEMIDIINYFKELK